MKETISIKNFGGLKDVTIPLNSINIFIGKQASGKSVTAKLIYFFRQSFEDIFDGLTENKKQKDIEEEIIKRFKKYFPVDSWSKGKFSIKYVTSNEHTIIQNDEILQVSLASISIERRVKDSIKINCSELVNQISLLQKYISNTLQKEETRDVFQDFSSNPKDIAKFLYHVLSNQNFLKPFGFQIFIPAGRSFFSNIQSSIFSILATGDSIDPFIIEFGSFYERAKVANYDLKSEELQTHIQNSMTEVLGANFFSDKSGDYLIHKDGRKIGLLFCSSGQQESLPLVLILRNYFAKLNSMEFISNTIYIEEPETHLFPSAQKKIVEMIASAHNISKDKSQLVITTHSPYILTSFNNLLQAGQLLESGTNKKKLFKIVPEHEILKPGELNAYAFADGGVSSLIDEETGLISADLLDQVSEEIAIEFDELLNL
jgi:predicted ATPase